MAELVLSLCDLLEAEGRLLRQNIEKLGSGCGLLAIGLIFVLGSLAFVVAAIYEALALIWPKPFALLALALVCAFIAIIFVWSAKKCAPKMKAK